MEKLWIVTEIFYPEETSTAYILTRIANRLACRYEVHILCGPCGYEKRKRPEERPSGLHPSVSVAYLSKINLNKNNLLARLVRLCLLSIRLSWALWKQVKKNERVLIVTNPAPLLLLVSFLRRIRKFRLYVLVHDVFPENAVAAHLLSSGSLLYKWLRSLFNSAYSRADLLIVLGRDMKKVMKEKVARFSSVPRIEIIENWADVQAIIPQDRAILSRIPLPKDKIVIQYAGNLGRVQGLLPFLERVKEACNPAVHLSFWGEGAVRKEMEKYVDTHHLKQVSFHGGYARNEQNRVLNACDLALVTLAEGMYGLGVPSKTYNILAAGKAILFIGDLESEIALLLRETGIGYCFAPSDQQGICRFLSELSFDDLNIFRAKGRLARQLAEQFYSEEVLLNTYARLL